MKPQLAELLSALDGQELYTLSAIMSGAVATAATAAVLETVNGKDWKPYTDMVNELTVVRNDVLMQCCRIVVPLARAEKIVAASMFGRGHAVRVPGTT